MNNSSSGQGRVIAIIGGIAALVAIFIFATGIVDLPSIFSAEARLQRRLVGSWQSQNSSEMMVLYEDGSFASSGALLPSNGFYRVADENHITMQFSGLLSVVGTQTMEVDVDGDILSLREPISGSWTYFNKID